eukprot:UN25991
MKLVKCVNEILKFRDEQEKILEAHSDHSNCRHKHSDCRKKTLGDVTTVNLTMLKAGVTPDNGKTYAYNVIPTVAEAGFDIRISPDFPVKEFHKKMEHWTRDPQLSFTYVTRTPYHAVSSISKKDPWWMALKGSFDKCGMNIQVEVFPAGT